KELRRVAGVIGAHYPEFKSPDEAKTTGLPLWSSEDGFWNKTKEPWPAARILAKMYNRNYAEGRMVKTIIWSLITSYYDNLPLPGAGLMKANQPWTGHYEVQPATWVTAHTTQFAQPGWQYMDSACRSLPEGGSQVGLRNAKGDFSLIVETMDARAPQRVNFQLTGGLKAKRVHVWRTTERERFVQLSDIQVENGAFSVMLEPEAVYSFTTTRGQRKGAVKSIPAAADLTMPYQEDFESVKVGQTAKYLSDQAGVFEVVSRADGRGRCLRQVVTAKTIEWSPMQWPITLVGSAAWTNYEVSCDVKVEAGRVARLLGRAERREFNQGTGYALSLDAEEHWSLSTILDGQELAKGVLFPGAGRWHHLKLRCHGPLITAFVDQTQVAKTVHFGSRLGMVGFGAGGWYEAEFDNLRVVPIAEPPPQIVNLASGAKITGSSSWSKEYEAQFANDEKSQTRWNAAKGHLAGEWLELDFGKPVRFDTVTVSQFGPRITQYKLQALLEGDWRDVGNRDCKGRLQWADKIEPVTTAKLRFVVVAVTGSNPESDTASVFEIAVYDSSQLAQ
ncbi:MAG TPA: discoidin domain-containing protein, partial [Clostridia bacterium]|nr:discoidin domain-containing protein [Clostridia bacterium]